VVTYLKNSYSIDFNILTKYVKNHYYIYTVSPYTYIYEFFYTFESYCINLIHYYSLAVQLIIFKISHEYLDSLINLTHGSKIILTIQFGKIVYTSFIQCFCQILTLKMLAIYLGLVIKQTKMNDKAVILAV
jgi:hypothetical protein